MERDVHPRVVGHFLDHVWFEPSVGPEFLGIVTPQVSSAMHEGRVVKNLCVGRHIVFGRVVRIRGGIRVWVGVRDAQIDGNRREKAQGFVYHSAHYTDVRSIMSNALLRE